VAPRHLPCERRVFECLCEFQSAVSPDISERIGGPFAWLKSFWSRFVYQRLSPGERYSTREILPLCIHSRINLRVIIAASDRQIPISPLPRDLFSCPAMLQQEGSCYVGTHLPIQLRVPKSAAAGIFTWDTPDHAVIRSSTGSVPLTGAWPIRSVIHFCRGAAFAHMWSKESTSGMTFDASAGA
jgi:hypothetical protein